MTLTACAMFAAAAETEAPYALIDGGRLVGEPYRWMLADGTLLKKGLSDRAGKAYLVRRPGKTDYVLEMVWGRFQVQVPKSCWDLDPKDFQACAKWSSREDTQAQKYEATQEERLMQERRQFKEARLAWVQKQMTPQQREQILASTLSEHRTWMRLAEARLDVADFPCRILALPEPSSEAKYWFEKGRTAESTLGRDPAYAEAAARGHWRAAARLVSASMEDEDWESAEPIIAWLLKEKVPAGYNKLADLMAAMGAYDGATLSEVQSQVVTSLRWRAAQLGDPVAQANMSHAFEKTGRPALAKQLLDCAQKQNPEVR